MRGNDRDGSEMSHHTVIWLLLVAINLCAGCTSVRVPQQFLDKQESKTISTIGLLEVAEPKQFMAFSVGGPTVAFGLVGVFAEIERSKTLTAQFTKVMKARDVNMGRPLTEALQRALERKGFVVIRITGQSAVQVGQGDFDYTGIRANADAILNVSLEQSGYLAGGVGADFTVSVEALARLISMRTFNPIYRQTFVYSAKPVNIKGAKLIPAVHDISFPSFDDLIADERRSAEGIMLSIEPIAEAVANDLR